MRLVISIGGKSALSSSISLSVRDEGRVLGLQALAPNGLSDAPGADAAAELESAAARFEAAGDDALPLLYGRRGWALAALLIERGGAAGIFVYDDPALFIADRLANGANLMLAAEEWITTSQAILRVYEQCRSSVRLFNSADLASAPQGFAYFCDSEYGLDVKVVARPTAALEYVIAARYASTNQDVSDLAAELSARRTLIPTSENQDCQLSDKALAILQMLNDEKAEADDIRQRNALLSEQLRLVQSKTDIYFKKMAAKEKPFADRAKQEFEASKREIQRLKQEIKHARHEVEALRASTSWKITTPLRWVMLALRRSPHARERK